MFFELLNACVSTAGVKVKPRMAALAGVANGIVYQQMDRPKIKMTFQGRSMPIPDMTPRIEAQSASDGVAPMLCQPKRNVWAASSEHVFKQRQLVSGTRRISPSTQRVLIDVVI